MTPELKFSHNDGKIATASTCLMVLTIPTVHSSYQSFREYMILSFLGHGGIHMI